MLPTVRQHLQEGPGRSSQWSLTSAWPVPGARSSEARMSRRGGRMSREEVELAKVLALSVLSATTSKSKTAIQAEEDTTARNISLHGHPFGPRQKLKRTATAAAAAGSAMARTKRPCPAPADASEPELSTGTAAAFDASQLECGGRRSPPGPLLTLFESYPKFQARVVRCGLLPTAPAPLGCC